MPRGRVLITGAAGYLARHIAREFVAEGREVLLWMRPDPEREHALWVELAPRPGQLAFAHGALEDELPFEGIDPRSIETIVHGAAVTRFNVERELAQSINVEGLRKLLDFAEDAPRLERLVALSTVYSHGLRQGELREEPLPTPPEFANHYERSKWQAEQLLATRDLPWQIHRVSTVIANDESGTVEQFNAFHNTLKLLYYGLLSVVPGEAETPLYFVTARFAARATHELCSRGDDRGIYHLSHGRQDSATLGELIHTAFEVFQRDPGFRARRILPPLLCDAQAFHSLAEGLDSFGGPVVRQSVQSMAPFAPQLFTHKTVTNDRLVSSLERYAPPEARALIARTCAFLVARRFGKREARRA